MNRVVKAQNLLLDLVFPRRCLVCNTQDYWLCAECANFETEVQFFDVDSFPVCSLFDFDQAAIRESVHNLKYGGINEMAAVLIDLAKSRYGNSLIQEYCGSNSVLVPIPTSTSKLKMRGYNQAEELAKCLTKWVHLPINTTFLQKFSSRQSQVGKTAEQRSYEKNLFHCSKTKLMSKDKTVILVDDVYSQ